MKSGKRRIASYAELFLCLIALGLFSVLVGRYAQNKNLGGDASEVYFKLLGQVYEINLRLERVDERYPNEKELSVILREVGQMGVAQADALGVDMKKVAGLVSAAHRNRAYISQLRTLYEDIAAAYESGSDCEESITDYLNRVKELPQELACDLQEETLALDKMLIATLQKKRDRGDKIANEIHAFFAENPVIHTALEERLNGFSQQAVGLVGYSEKLSQASAAVERARSEIDRIEREIGEIADGAAYLHAHYYSGSGSEISALRMRIGFINEIDRAGDALTLALARLTETEERVKVVQDTMQRMRSYVSGLRSYEPEEISIRNLDYIGEYLSVAEGFDARDRAALADELNYLVQMKEYLETRGYAEDANGFIEA